MTKSKIFLYFCLSFVAGIFVNSIISIPQLFILGFLILGIMLISVFWGSKQLAVLGFCLLFLVAGAWRHQAALLRIKNSEIAKYNDSAEQVIFTAKVIKEPDIRESTMKLTVAPFLDSGQKSKGRILVTTSKYPEYEYGDKLRIAGKLQAPANFDDFNYRNYLAKDGIYSVVYMPEIELLAKGQGKFLYTKILSLKKRLSENINKFLSPPQSSLLAGILLGEQNKMSEELKQQLNITGLRHITSVSGMHVAILANVLLAFLIGLGFWRQHAFYITIILIVLFVVLTGFQPAAIRAGIMAGFLLLAKHLERLGSASRAVVFAAVLMLLNNPLLLSLDIGFQLSFLAIMGIIYLGPFFQNILSFLPKERIIGLKDILTTTFSAYLATLPLLLYNFGTSSLLAPFSNVLILPSLPALLCLGFIAALTGLIWQPLTWFFSLPVWLLLSYMIKIIEGLGSFYFSSFVLKISWLWLFGSYLCLAIFSFWLNKKYKKPFYMNLEIP